MYQSINKTKLIILFLLIFIVCYVNFCLYLIKYKRDRLKLSSFQSVLPSVLSSSCIEGYSPANPEESYTTCINMGYGSDFCSQTPVYNVNTKKLEYCNCADNRYGTYQFNNKCHCILDRPSDYVYVPQLFQNYR